MAKVTKSLFDTMSNGSSVYLYTLENAAGCKAGVITYGARLYSFVVPDAQGNMQDIILGYEKAEGYNSDPSMGASVGRNANRIHNAKITINGVDYQLEKNNGANKTNNLHSGASGFHRHIWGAREDNGKVVMTYFSPDGDGGFPGNFTAQVTYELTEDNALKISYNVTTDADTICNMTNHSYFNLNGMDGSDVLEQKMQIFADKLTEADEDSLPNGVIYEAKGTPMDFQQLTPIGEHINDDFNQLKWAGGYDHNWILNGALENGLRKAAYAESPKTGITLTTYTDLPGIQFYSGNYLKGAIGKKGNSYTPRTGFCLETQYYPNSLEHPEFPQPILKKGETWTSVTIYKAGVKK